MSPNMNSETQKKTLASPIMTRVKPLSPYLQAANRIRVGTNNGANASVPSSNPLMKYAVNKKDPNDLLNKGVSANND